MNRPLAELIGGEPPQKPKPLPIDDVETLEGFAKEPKALSRWEIHPHDTVILDFKQESTFIVKLDPGRPITLEEQPIDPRLLIGLCDASTVQFEPFAVVRDAYSDEYFSQDEFWRAKSERREQQKTLKTARINIASAFLLCERRFLQSNSKNAFLLNPASLAFLLDFSAVADVFRRRRIIINDDFDGITTAAVCEKLQRESQFCKPCGFLADCQLFSELVGESIDDEALEKLKTLEFQCREFLLDFKRQANIPGYEELCVLTTGNTAPGAIKDCLIDANLIPNSVDHATESRPPTAPPVFHFNLWRFVAQTDAILENFGIFRDENVSQDQTTEITPLNSENIIKELDFEYCNWLERRMAYFGVDGCLLGRIVRLRRSDAGVLELTPRGEYVPYYHAEVPYLQFDSLIIAAKTRPLPALRALQNLLNPGAPVAVFTEVLPPMEELSRYIIKDREGTRFEVTKLEEIAQQVLPGRTHPHMIGPLATGYCAGFYIQGGDATDGDVVNDKKGDFLKNKREKKVR